MTFSVKACSTAHHMSGSGVKLTIRQRFCCRNVLPTSVHGLIDTIYPAAGHIDLDETPLDAALREAKEEINLDIVSDELKLFGVHRAYLKADNGVVENEFQWLYSLELASNTDFTLQASEVESLAWTPLSKFKVKCTGNQYVPHGTLYYDTVSMAIESAAH